MTLLLKKPARFPAIGIPIVIGLICFLFSRWPALMVAGDKLSTAITLDCCLTAPLLYWVLVRLRTGKAPVMAIARIFAGGLVLAGFLLQHRPHSLLQVLRTWVFPVVEAGVLGMIVVRFYKARAAARISGMGTTGLRLGETGISGAADFLPFCRSILHSVTGNKLAGNLIGSELAVIYYCFLGKMDPSVDYKTTFSTYKQNGILLVLGVFLGLFAVEITATHLLVGGNRPGKEVVKLGLLGDLEGHNIMIRLKEPVVVTRLFGKEVHAQTVVLFVDQPDNFIEALENKGIKVG